MQSAGLASENTTGDVVSCVGDASRDSSSSVLCGEEDSNCVQSRVAREPIDRSRYIVVNSSGGAAMFACSRCSKQYIHRKSLNKHWNDKHAYEDNTDTSTKYLISTGTGSFSEPPNGQFSMQLVQCPSDTVHVALSASSSLLRSAVQSYAVSSAVPLASSQQKTQSSDKHRSRAKRRVSITDSVLWHSLAAIHLNPQEQHNLNSFRCVPMPAHIAGHYDGRENFLKQLFYDDDCQVLDLSKGSSSARGLLSDVSIADAPLDLSMKSQNLASDGEKASVHDETIAVSAASCCADISVLDSLILNKPKSADAWVVKLCSSMKDGKTAQLDSIAVLRHLHSGVLTNAVGKSGQANSGCHSAVAFLSEELKSGQPKVEPSDRRECRHNSMHFKHNLNVISKLPGVATLKETHEFFGGVSRGGHIKCKVCEFSATTMLLFSQHVARHTRKLHVSDISVQNQRDDGVDEEYGFFTQLGLRRMNSAEVDIDQRSSAICHCVEDDSWSTYENSSGRCEAAVVCELDMPAAQANGIRSHPKGGALGQQRKKTSSSAAIRQKQRAGYQRGLGLTTTESRDAAGRSWRRRRLRTCDHCGYVTDNLTTLKRHEEKHGAPGMYRCKLCNYTVNQQHILEYHTRNAHRPPRQAASTNSSLFKDTDVPFSNNSADEDYARTASSSVGNGNQVSWTKDLPDTVNTSNSAIQGGQAAFSFRSQLSNFHTPKAMSKNVQYPTSVTQARRYLLDAYDLQLSRGMCIRCGFRSLSQVKMKWHKLQHPHERHICTLCPHTSLTTRLLLKHTGQHSDCRTTGYLAQRKTYPCPECPFLAASPQRLQCHTQFHGVKLRHVCGKCSYSVDRANLIAQHRRLHSSASVTVQKRRRLHCSKCPFRTISQLTLVNHERGHYAVNCQYMCSLCSFGTDVANVAFGHQCLHSRSN